MDPIPFRQRLARNTLAAMATNVWTIVLTVVSLPLVLHGLGTRAYGVWVFVQTFSASTGWLSIPATGLAVAGTRHVASRGERHSLASRQAAGAVAAVLAGTGVVLGLLVAGLLPTIVDRALDLGPLGTSLRAVGIAVGVQVAAEHGCLILTAVLEGHQEVSLARSIDALRKTAMAIAAAIVATAGGGLQGVAVASAVAAVAATLLAAGRCWATARVRLAAPSRGDVSHVVRYAGTVSAVTGTGVVHRTMDRTIAGVALGPSAVALVDIANQLQAGATALLSASTYPVLSSAPWLEARDDRPALAALLLRATRYSVLLTLPLCGLGLVLADPFIRAWVGDAFVEAVGLTQVALVFVVIAAPLQAGGNLLQGMGRAGQVLRASAASVLVNLVVSVVLVHTVGLIGVMIGTVVGELVLFPLLARSVGQALDQPPLTAIRPAVARAVPAALAAAAGAGAAVLLSLSPLPTVVLGGALGAVAGLAVAIGWSLPADERTELRAALGRRVP